MIDAYAAGLIDGEGTISLMKTRTSDTYRSPTVSISSTTIEMLEFMKSHFGGSIVNHKTYQEHHKPTFNWVVKYDRAIEVIKHVYSYLLEPRKKARANYILLHYKKLTKRNGKYTNRNHKAKMLFEKGFFHPSTPSVNKLRKVPISL